VAARGTSLAVYLDALIAGAAVVFGMDAGRIVIGRPRRAAASSMLKTGRFYHLYGFRHSVLRAVDDEQHQVLNAMLVTSAPSRDTELPRLPAEARCTRGLDFAWNASRLGRKLQNTVGPGTLVSDGLRVHDQTEFSDR